MCCCVYSYCYVWRCHFGTFVGFVPLLGDHSSVIVILSVGTTKCSRMFWHNMQAAGADLKRVHAVQGNFMEIFKNPRFLHQELGLQRCLVAHIDCDVYLAAKASLDFLTDLLVQGSILLFDEYHSHGASNRLGERRALAEWLEENPQIKVERWQDYATFARAFFVHVEHKQPQGQEMFC